MPELEGRRCGPDLISSEAALVCNVLLSVFALFFGGLPETGTSRPDRDIVLSAIFRDDEPTLAPVLTRPRWLQISRDNEPVIRGQGPDSTYESPPSTAPLATPYQPYDPFQIQAGPDPVLPFLNDPGQTIMSPGHGNFSIQQYDAALRHISMLGPDWVFTNTAQFGARIWSGPNQPNLPGSVYRLGWDFLLNSPQMGKWSAQLDFNPSINSDFSSSLGRESLQLDAYGALFYRASPKWMYVLGVQYWDRVNNIIFPYGGVVWNPNERLELRLLFPKSRISYFVGNFGNGSHWLYATGEYHVESYQISMPGVSGREEIQLTDWRLGIGLRSDHSWYDKYVEIGYVFGRQNIFSGNQPGFDVNNGIMARFGVRF